MVSVVVYTQEFCPNCEKLKNLLKKFGISFAERDIKDKKTLFEFRYKAFFPREAPVLQIEDLYYESRDIFRSDSLSEQVRVKLGITERQ